jgi:hypothetical protein
MEMNESTFANVGDLILLGRSVFRVTGVYLGAVGVQNIIGLKSITLKSGSAHGQTIREMLVPEELIKGLDLFRRVEKPRPTIEELDKLLNSNDDSEVTVQRDGSITAE